MTFDPSQLALLLGIATLANAIIAAIVEPLFDKYSLDKFWLMYISWVIAGVLAFLGNINLFGAVFQSAIIGQVLTAVIAGRASNILHDLTDQQSTVLFMTESKVKPDEG
jgi:hypothetical protein